MTQTTPQTTILFPDEYREAELYEALAAQEAKQAADEHSFRVHINTRATENRAAQLQKSIDEANEAARIAQAAEDARMHSEEKQAREARKKARDEVFICRLVCCLFATITAARLLLVDAISLEIAMIVFVASLAWICWEMFWAFRGIYRLLFR